MFNIGGGEVIVIMLIALIVLGPQRLPSAARQVGKAMGELRRLSTGFQNEVRTAFEDVDDPDRVAARRNVLAKEARVVDAPATEPGDVPVPVDGPPPAARPAARPARRTPLKAAPAEKTPAKKAAAKKAPSKGAKRTAS